MGILSAALPGCRRQSSRPPSTLPCLARSAADVSEAHVHKRSSIKMNTTCTASMAAGMVCGQADGALENQSQGQGVLPDSGRLHAQHLMLSTAQALPPRTHSHPHTHAGPALQISKPVAEMESFLENPTRRSRSVDPDMGSAPSTSTASGPGSHPSSFQASFNSNFPEQPSRLGGNAHRRTDSASNQASAAHRAEIAAVESGLPKPLEKRASLVCVV